MSNNPNMCKFKAREPIFNFVKNGRGRKLMRDTKFWQISNHHDINYVQRNFKVSSDKTDRIGNFPLFFDKKINFGCQNNVRKIQKLRQCFVGPDRDGTTTIAEKHSGSKLKAIKV